MATKVNTKVFAGVWAVLLTICIAYVVFLAYLDLPLAWDAVLQLSFVIFFGGSVWNAMLPWIVVEQEEDT